MEQGINLHASNDKVSIDIDRSSNTFVSERITRDYGNGRTEWDEQILPAGTNTDGWARASGGTGRETEYQLHIDAADGVPSGESRDVYPGHRTRDLDLRFTGDEIEQARQGSGKEYRDNTSYLASVAQSADGEPVNASNKLYNDYNGIRNAADPGPANPKVPGQLAK